MRVSVRVVLALVILTGMAFVSGFVAGWSNGNASRAVSRDAPEPESPRAVQPYAAREELNQDPPREPAAQSSSSAAGSSSDGMAKPRPSPSVTSAPARQRPSSPSTPAVSEARVPPKAGGAAASSPAVAPPIALEPAPGGKSDATNGAPSVFVKDTTYDYGVVLEGDAVHGQFVFENRGTAPLVVQKVSTSCGCTAALVSTDVLAPGDSGKVEASLRTLGYKGGLTKQIYLETNDPVNPRLVLKLTGTVKRDIDVTPPFIDFGVIAPGATISKTVRVASAQGVPFSITKLSASSPAVHLSEPRKLAGGGCEFDVTVGPVPEPRRITNNIFIEMDSTRQPRLVMVLFGNIVAPREGAGE